MSERLVVQGDAIYFDPAEHPGADPHKYYRNKIKVAEIAVTCTPESEFQKRRGRLQEALNLLEEYERWETDLVREDLAWEHGFPALTQDLYDRLVAMQEKRNALLHPKG